LDQKVVNIKWYTPSLISSEGFNIYRRDEGSNAWLKINSAPIRFKDHRISEEELKKDSELKKYMEIGSDPARFKDLVFLAIVLKSFKSDAFSKYLGIRYDDHTVKNDVECLYKVTALVKGKEIDLGQSEKIRPGKYLQIECPKEIRTKIDRSKISFAWLPEPQRYYGVNIYRQQGDTGLVNKVTKDPVILSKTKNRNGELSYGEDFFIDQIQCPGTYNYTFEAVDFFGSGSALSRKIQIVLKDQKAPRPPNEIFHRIEGRKVTLVWKNKSREPDFAGYHIYRTNRNDTDFVRINKFLIPINDSSYIDTVIQYKSYLYKISGVDNDLNESLSNPHFAEVYDIEPPSQPAKPKIESDTGKLTLRWESNKESDLKGYLVYRTINSNNTDSYVKLSPTPQNDTVFVELQPRNTKNTFFYKIVAVDEYMNRSNYSEYVKGCLPDVTPPAVPFLKSVVRSENGNVVLEWIPNAEQDLAGYSVYRKNLEDSVGSYQQLNVKLLERNVFRYQDRYPQEGSLYCYYIKAKDSSGNLSPPSNSLRIHIKEKRELKEIKIAGFAASYNPKRQRVELKWRIQNEENYKGSVVYKLKPKESGYSPITGIIGRTKLSDGDIEPNSMYCYEVRVYDLKGDVYRSKKLVIEIK